MLMFCGTIKRMTRVSLKRLFIIMVSRCVAVMVHLWPVLAKQRKTQLLKTGVVRSSVLTRLSVANP